MFHNTKNLQEISHYAVHLRANWIEPNQTERQTAAQPQRQSVKNGQDSRMTRIDHRHSFVRGAIH